MKKLDAEGREGSGRKTADPKFLESIRRPLWKAFRAGPSLPKTLYHYTDAPGLAGIVESRRIWAIDYRFTNDRSELIAGEALLLDELRAAAAAAREGSARELLKRLSDSLRANKVSATEGYRTFVASFAENGDLLSQWRAYGADGAGFSLGFARGDLEDVARYPKAQRPGAIYAVQCEYDEARFRQRVSSAVRAISPHLAGWRRWTQQRQDGFLDEITPWAVLMAHGFKHKGFAEEHEWRFVCLWSEDVDGAPAVQHRTSARGVIPYVCIPLPVRTAEDPTLLLESLCVGPSAMPEQARQGVESLLQRHGYDWRRIVRPSRIPYRRR